MQTVLFSFHKNSGAKIVDFNGWEMPLYYSGIINEHLAVRTHVGIFDVSHMGLIEISGPDAFRFLDHCVTNHIRLEVATYAVLCNNQGGCIDDILLFKLGVDKFLMVVNAGNRKKDLKHLQNLSRSFDVELHAKYDSHGILALQGPDSLSLIEKVFPGANKIAPKHFVQIGDIILSRTGYTGEEGFELFAPNEKLPELWQRFMDLGVPPIGLGARDSLRLEMGYALYGHEVDETIAVTESVAAWTVKWDKQFIGKESLLRLKESAQKRNEYGIVLLDQGVLRAGYEIFREREKIGKVTSGGYSPTLKQSIGIVLVRSTLNDHDHIKVSIRGKLYDAQVVPLPFLPLSH